MLSDFKFIQTDERNKYKTKLRSSRLNSQSVPKLIDSINIVDNSTKSYVVRNVEQFDTLKEEFGNEFRDGHVCYMLGGNGEDHLIYVWSETDDEWIPISLSGTVNLTGYRKTSDKINLETEVTGIVPNANIEELGNIGTQTVDETDLANNVIPVYDLASKTYKLMEYKIGGSSETSGLIEDIEKNKTSITEIKSELTDSDGKLKMDSVDTNAYLEERIDKKTIHNVNNKLVVKSIEGLIANVDELNQTKNARSNIQKQIDDIEVRDFNLNPLDLEKEVKGKLPVNNVNDSIITDKDINKDVIGKITGGTDGKLEFGGKPVGKEFEYDDKDIKLDLDNKRGKDDKIIVDDLDTTIKDKIDKTDKIDKIETDLDNKRGKDDKITADDLDTTVKDKVDKIDKIETDLDNKRGKDDKITADDLDTTVIDRIEELEDSGFEMIESEF